MLTPPHRLYLEQHAVDARLAEALGVSSVSRADDVPEPFRWLNGSGHPAILYPWRSDAGSEWLQLHPDTPPLDADGKEMKYVFPKGETPVLWRVHDPKTPKGVLLVEGTKQALAVASTGIEWRVYAMAGCSSWSSDGAPVPSSFNIADGLPLVVALDADLGSNPHVWDSGRRMLNELPAVTGATSVKMAKSVGSQKAGMDDVLARVPSASRRAFVERLVAGATAEIGGRPKEPVGRGLAYFGQSGLFLPMTAAEILDQRSPFAIHESADAVYRYSWDRGCYERIVAFGTHLSGLMGDLYQRRYATDTLDCAKAVAERNKRVLDGVAPSPLIPVRNGILDPRTSRLMPPSPDHLLMGRWDVEWDPSATCPTIMAYLEHHFPSQVDTILDTVARMLDRVNPQDRVLFLFGKSRSGKSTVLRVISALVGPEATSSETLHALAKERWAIAQLYGKSLNVAADLSADDVRETGMFKSLTGGDRVSGENKFEQKFSFESHAFLAFSANSIPALPAESEAELTRFVPVYAGRSFVGREDPTVEAALMAELPGLLVELVRRFQAGRKPRPVNQVANEFRRSADRVARFAEEHLVHLRAGETLRADGTDAVRVYELFRTYVERNGYAAIGRNKFYDRLRSQGYLVAHSDGNKVGATLRPKPTESSEFREWVRTTFDGDGGDGEESSGPREPPGWDGSDGSSSATHAQGTEEERESRTYEAPEGGENDPNHPTASVPSDGRTDPAAGSTFVFDLETRDAAELHQASDEPFVRLVGSSQGVVTAETVVAHPGPLVAHNGFGFDFLALARHHRLDMVRAGDDGRLIDTMILGILDHPPMRTNMNQDMRSVLGEYSLNAMAKRYGTSPKLASLGQLAKEFGGYDRIPMTDKRYRDYCLQDVASTREILEALPSMDSYAQREMRLMSRLSWPLSGIGFRVDVELVAAREDERQQHLAELTATLIARYGIPPRKADGSQAKSVTGTREGKKALERAFRDAGIDLPRTGGGLPSLSAHTMRAVIATGTADQRALAEVVLALNGERTIYKTVLDNLHGDRVHPSVQPIQASGRFSIWNPGLTVMGKRGGRVKERAIFLPDEGHVLISADLSQVDARAVAVHSQDPAYLALFQPGVDAHAEIAYTVWGDRSRRNDAKAIGHGWNYGMGLRRISQETGLSLEAARQFDCTMKERFPALVAWRERVREQARFEVLDNGFGRHMRSHPDRVHTQAPALMGQGTARDLMMEGILRMPADMIPMLRAVVHDEVVLSVPIDVIDDAERALLRALQFEWAPPGALQSIHVEANLATRGVSWEDCYRG